MVDIYEGLTQEQQDEQDRLDAEADEQMAQAEGRWVDGGCQWLTNY